MTTQQIFNQYNLSLAAVPHWIILQDMAEFKRFAKTKKLVNKKAFHKPLK